MAYKSVEVEVDIDLDEFDTDELISELVDRLKKSGRKGFTVIQKNNLISELEDINKALGVSGIGGIEIKTLDDEMKVEHLSRVWHLYPSHILENRLPEY